MIGKNKFMVLVVVMIYIDMTNFKLLVAMVSDFADQYPHSLLGEIIISSQ